MKKFFKNILVLFILSFVIYFVVIGYARMSNNRLLLDATKPDVTFYIISHRWHMGLILPRHIVEGTIGELPFSPSEWVEVGWGDRQYYMNDGFSATGALKALSWPSDGVMHLVTVNDDMLQNIRFNNNVKEYIVAETDFANMLVFLQESFSEKEDKIPLASSLYGEGAFFASPLTYHFFYTCNGWIAEVMKKAGYKSYPFVSQHPVTLNMQLP